MRKATTKTTIKRKTIADMKRLGVHKVEYNRLIDIYAGLVHQYMVLTIKFEEGGFKYQVETDQGGAKKAPIVATLENLRKDILAYSDRLCLSPKAFENVTADASDKKSPLDEALKKLAT